MNSRTHRLIARRVLAFAFIASVMTGLPHYSTPRDYHLWVAYSNGETSR